MRRRITARDGLSEREQGSPTPGLSKRREVSSLDRAATERSSNSGERGRLHGRHRSDRDHHKDSGEQIDRKRKKLEHTNTDDSSAQRPSHRDDKNMHGAKTFRRGRVLMFLKQLQVKRSTLMQQLEQPEFKSIEQVISGELKAVDDIIQQFTHLFEIQENESDNPTNP